MSPIMMATISGSFRDRMRAFSTTEHSFPLVNTSMACFAALPATRRGGGEKEEEKKIEIDVRIDTMRYPIKAINR